MGAKFGRCHPSEATVNKILAVALVATTACATQSGTNGLPVPAGVPSVASPTPVPGEPLVEFEMMTWPEVKAALAAGKTTALFYTGGTEQRGPQNVNGGHNLMGRATAKAIALKLGNAIAMPVLPYTPNNASATLPGTIGLTNEILAAILERVSEQAIVTGFRNVVLLMPHFPASNPAQDSSRDAPRAVVNPTPVTTTLGILMRLRPPR